MLNLMALVLATAPLLSASPKPYDEQADARVEIARMLECAREEKKPLLLMFGANWCEWCLGLDRLLGTDKEMAKLTDEVFLRFNVDIGQYDRNLDVAAKYGLESLDDTGIPMLVVLRPDGSVQEVTNSEDLVSGSRYSRSAVRRFLRSYLKR